MALIDSLAGLRIAALDETRFHEFVYSLTQRFSRQGVSMLMTFETPDLFRVERISDSAVSHLSDNVVLLNYVNDHDSIQQAQVSHQIPHRPITSPGAGSF